jgi:hypothetical protein
VCSVGVQQGIDLGAKIAESAQLGRSSGERLEYVDEKLLADFAKLVDVDAYFGDCEHPIRSIVIT